MRTFSAPVFPVRAAIISAVSPLGVSGMFGSAPALISFSIMRRAAVDRGQLQRGRAVAIGRGDFRARANQHVRGIEIVVTHSPQQRGRAVVLRRVDVGFLLHQRADGRGVAPHDGVGNIARRRRGGC